MCLCSCLLTTVSSLLLYYLGYLAAALSCGTGQQLRPRLAEGADVHSVSQEGRGQSRTGQERSVDVSSMMMALHTCIQDIPDRFGLVLGVFDMLLKGHIHNF